MKEKIEEIREFAKYLDRIDEPKLAEFFRSCSSELQLPISKEKTVDIWLNIYKFLDGGSGSISDRYLAYPNGKPDPVASRNYLDSLNHLRRTAFKSLPLQLRVKVIFDEMHGKR